MHCTECGDTHPKGVSCLSFAQDNAAMGWSEAAGLKDRVDELEAGIKAVQDLIDESDGVYGLHRNGDVAPWSELLAGGQFEDWLIAFSTATGEGER